MMRFKTSAMRVLSRFRRDRDGATAIEFAMVSVPFFGIIFAIVETGLVFFTGQVMDAAANRAGRTILTGQIAAIADATTKANTFKTKFCEGISWYMDCNSIYYDVQSYNSFSAANLTLPISAGNFDSTGLPRFNPGTAGQIVVVRAYYPRKIYVDLLGSQLGYLNGGYHLIVATAVFKNEPF